MLHALHQITRVLQLSAVCLMRIILGAMRLTLPLHTLCLAPTLTLRGCSLEGEAQDPPPTFRVAVQCGTGRLRQAKGYDVVVTNQQGQVTEASWRHRKRFRGRPIVATSKKVSMNHPRAVGPPSSQTATGNSTSCAGFEALSHCSREE